MNLIRRILRKIRKETRFLVRRLRYRRIGIRYLPPDYIFLDVLDESSMVADVGCGSLAEFSLQLIDEYGCLCYGVDPTRKHRPALKLHEENKGGRFIHLPYAVAAESGTITFHESAQNESGSLLDDHGNVLHDDIRSYEVETVDLGGLLDRMQADSADYLKLDLEGAEYELLAQVGSEDLAPFRQVFVEFHHHIIDNRSTDDTRELVSRLKSFGLEPYSLDEHNYLFLSPEAQATQKALGAQA